MTIRVAIQHRTTYTFDRPVTVHPHTVRLRPAPHSRTPIAAYSLTVLPRDHFLNWQQDAFGNYLGRLVFPEKVGELDIIVDLVADMTVINPFDFFVEDYAETYPFTYPSELRADLDPYLRPVDDGAEGAGPGPLVSRWVTDHVDRPAGGTRIVDFLVAINQRIRDDVDYSVRLETGVQQPDETLTKHLGSCRDSAWLLVSVLRQLGLAARFVSGYLVQLTADQEAIGGPSGPTEDFTDLHAWAEVYVPGAGWVGLDATSGLFAGEGHIPLCATPHPSSAAPISGATDFADVQFSFSNSVTRVFEDPRVTRPYSVQQWQGVEALGGHVDTLLNEADVRLTMGGEPTFVSNGDTSDAQWETAADGDEKRRLATTLAEKLRARWAANGLTHHGQGKWYPGEPLPRWQIGLLWRRDGQPLWRDQMLLDDPWSPPRVEPGSPAAGESVRDLALAVAARLGGAPRRRGRGDPRGLRRPAERAAQRGAPAAGRTTRGARCTGGERADPRPGAGRRRCCRGYAGRLGGARLLRPGRRRVGHRPLAHPPRAALPDAGHFPARAPAAAGIGGLDRGAVRAGPVPVRRPRPTARDRADRCTGRRTPGTGVRHRGLTAHRTGGAGTRRPRLRLPAALRGLRAWGQPARGNRGRCGCDRNPGVIEVNLQPTGSWAELVTLTESLDDDARHSGLATEKFDLDGTHTGTGGGNHITLGGITPADSPVLRRPDLLRSMITFWQHHPALSYVFSGRFIGPTSQSPRVDEGRAETLYELEIAFAELERVTKSPLQQGKESLPWLTDRLLRHLLTDVTGNTHRSEFCIDKLYSPDSDRGRLGLLEMRGFEMPPHPRMALVQALLVRTLVARFWDRPYAAPLIPWGTRLHDRFLLPAFAEADLRDVIQDVNEFLSESTPDAPQFDPAWIGPFHEFRFPRLGEVDVAGVHLELRAALEPWNVLGEEVGLGGTSRYVDSSVERVQVAATGLQPERHVVTCNGIPVPLLPVPGSGGQVAGGVRYRAWAPPSALHPTIGVHSPLVFDLVDRWNNRSMGGFTYHVTHPGGRSYDRYPVNAAEAETRRGSRFETTGHTAGTVDTSRWPVAVSTAYASSDYPATLDLRRFSAGHKATS